MKQLSGMQIEKIVKAAADDSFGFTTKRKGTVTLDISEIVRVAERAAFKALEMAGCTANADKAEADTISAKANEVTRRQKAICKAAGISF